MSLLKSLSFLEYQKAENFSIEQCEVISKLANLRLSFNNVKTPGKMLIKALDRSGYSVADYRQLVTASKNVKTISTYYRPQSKIAILVANDEYNFLPKLATPSKDCETLAHNLKEMGFITVLVKNGNGDSIKEILKHIIDTIPSDSYVVFFYAGHGVEICNTKCMLCIDCPTNDVTLGHCIAENYVLGELAKCKPELCVLILDMCRHHLDINSNPKIFCEIPFIEGYTTHSNLLISYSSSHAAYEEVQIECSTTIDCNKTYELKDGDTARITPGASQYVKALCPRLSEDLDVSKLLDKVHEDVENLTKKQKPIKVQCGVAKRSLYDPVICDTTLLLEKLRAALSEYKHICTVL